MANFPRTSASHTLQRLVDDKKARYILFLATFLLAFFITVILSKRGLIGLNFVWLFPLGLLSFFGIDGVFARLLMMIEWLPKGYAQMLFFGQTILGWLIYIGIARMGIRTPRRRVFILTYIIFMALLIANVAGCQSWIEMINKPR